MILRKNYKLRKSVMSKFSTKEQNSGKQLSFNEKKKKINKGKLKEGLFLLTGKR